MPVLPLLEDTLKPCASMMRSYQEAYELALEEPSAESSSEELQNLRELQDAARTALHAHQQATRDLTRQLAIHSELAAQADRRGWKWLRDRHVRRIANLVLQMTTQQPDADLAEDSSRDGDAPKSTDQRQEDP